MDLSEKIEIEKIFISIGAKQVPIELKPDRKELVDLIAKTPEKGVHTICFGIDNHFSIVLGVPGAKQKEDLVCYSQPIINGHYVGKKASMDIEWINWVMTNTELSIINWNKNYRIEPVCW